MRVLLSVTVLMFAFSLSACATAPPPATDLKSVAPSNEGPSATQIANLTAVDTSAPATGPSVHELITVEDVKNILGRDDVVFADAL